jgi:hypothetical protein
LEGVGAGAGVVGKVAAPAAHVGEKVANGGGGFVGHSEVGEVGPDGGIQCYFAHFDEAHDGGGGVGFGDGADLEEGVAGDGQGVVDVGDAKAGGACLAGVEDAEPNTINIILI